MTINEIIGNEQKAQEVASAPKVLKNNQDSACEMLLKLILEKRELIEQKSFRRPSKWNQVKIHIYFFYFNRLDCLFFFNLLKLRFKIGVMS